MISAVLVVRNEEERMQQCLQKLFALRPVIDDIVVVDQDSTDRTKEIARHFTDRVFGDKAHGYCEASRPFAVAQAKNDWVLVIDADEELAADFIPKLAGMTRTNIDVYYLPFHICITLEGVVHTFVGCHPRLFRKSKMTVSDKLHIDSAPAPDAVCSIPSFDTETLLRETPAIFSHKTQAEQELDNERYKVLMGDEWYARR